MKKIAVMASVLLSLGVVSAQENPTPRPDQVVEQSKEIPGVFGTIKEIKDKSKIVVDVENGGSKTYNLADAKLTVDVAEGLAVGDKVKVIENKKKGARAVQIVRDVRQK